MFGGRAVLWLWSLEMALMQEASMKEGHTQSLADGHAHIPWDKASGGSPAATQVHEEGILVVLTHLSCIVL